MLSLAGQTAPIAAFILKELNAVEGVVWLARLGHAIISFRIRIPDMATLNQLSKLLKLKFHVEFNLQVTLNSYG